MKKKIRAIIGPRALVPLAAVAAVIALAISASASDSATTEARDAHANQAAAVVPAAGALAPAAAAPAERVIDQVQVSEAHPAPRGGGNEVILPHATAARAQDASVQALARKTCLASADLKSRTYVGTAVDWAHGVADFVTKLPLCRGVSMSGSGAAYAFFLGATPQGSGHPNVPLWPQQRVAATGWQKLSAAAGHHRFKFPRVVNQCAQHDVGLWSNGWNGTWPPALAGPGSPQPYEVAFYVGNNHGCLVPPAVRVVAKCKGDYCDGHGSATYTCTNPNPYATLRCWLSVGATKRSGLTVGPRKSATDTVALNDDDSYHFTYQLGFGRWGNETGVGGTYVLNCPPVPHLVMSIDCPCLGALSGRFEDRNTTRYTHVLTLATGGHVLATLVVAPHSTAVTGALSWAKGHELVVTNQSQLGATKVGPVVRVATVHIS